jgi:3-hydroxyacyl-CoA dehydrogenase
MPESFRRDFMITHFFNPPRYMRLLELVKGEKTRADALKTIREFCDVDLGKGVVDCKDTPGFIANRIGCFWMTAGLVEAIKHDISVEDADAVLSRPIGVPKTGVFGLLDLIGIDLLPLIGKSMLNSLPKKDAFCQIYQEPEVVTNMIRDGYTGRKGKGGFYRLNKENGQKVKEVINLKTGEYSKAEVSKLESVDAAKAGLTYLLTHDDVGGRYAWSVMSQTLAYTASLIPEISDDIASVDEAMRLGYNWKYGPFELIDRLNDGSMSGAKWLATELEAHGMAVPELLTKIGNQSFYKQDDTSTSTFHLDGSYHQNVVDQHVWMLADKKRGQKPILKNPSAALWDIGDGIACFEYTSKMGRGQ